MGKHKLHKTNVMRLLDQQKISYQVHEYPWDDHHLDAKSAASGTGLPTDLIFKTLVATGDKTGVIVACIPANYELNLKKFAKVSGNKKVDMLAMKDLEKTTGYIRGGCSPIGMKKQYPTYIAAMAETMEKIVISAGKRGMQVELLVQDLKQMVHATFGEIIL